ncbi:MAG: hypothetical protein QMC80_02765 [Thermoplasmatales archaeon]|nr:hypothetical protein [Thermoplasmatales archaeon]
MKVVRDQGLVVRETSSLAPNYLPQTSHKLPSIADTKTVATQKLGEFAASMTLKSLRLVNWEVCP